MVEEATIANTEKQDMVLGLNTMVALRSDSSASISTAIKISQVHAVGSNIKTELVNPLSDRHRKAMTPPYPGCEHI